MQSPISVQNRIIVQSRPDHRQALTEIVGKLPDRIMDTIDDGLRLVTNLQQAGCVIGLRPVIWGRPAKTGMV